VTNKSPLLFVAFLVLAGAPSLALAGQPDSHCIGYYDTIHVVDCGDFSVMDDAMVFAHIKDYCDQEGDLTRSHIKLTARDNFYRDDDPKAGHLTGTMRFNERADFDEAGIPQWTPSPITVGVHARGLGYKFLDVGMLEMDTIFGWSVAFSADRFNDWTPADFEALCTYFE
jgi:hypothetical protein